MVGKGGLAAGMLAVILAAGGTVGGSPLVITVAPGTIVRWPALAGESCASGDRVWAPLADACWVPVDLLASGEIVVTRSRPGWKKELILRIGPYPYPEQHLTVPERMVHLSPEDLERSRRESARVAALWSRHTRPLFSLPIHPPLQPLPRGERFGARRVFNQEPRSPHTGVDYRAAAGTPVLAAEGGTVVLAEEHFFAGNSVFIDHGGGLISMYFHLAELAVREGDQVRRGQTVGAVGSTGRSTGPHLHFGIRWLGARVDPALLLEPAGAIRVDGP